MTMTNLLFCVPDFGAINSTDSVYQTAEYRPAVVVSQISLPMNKERIEYTC